MKRSDFDHAIRAAGAVVNANEVLVIGSQAIHASLAEPLPVEAARSVEVDIAIPGDTGHHADLIDGSIGEASMFNREFGIYAQGVSETTAVLPAGWRDRLVRYESPATSGVVAWCLELHDLWISKAVAGREKDQEFCTALLGAGLVDPALLRDRLSQVADLAHDARARVEAWIDRNPP